ncbi:tetratricopeptide repeat protein, partial [Providencia stuartii]|uniref:tetratricopeptide repeat protein n=1 Tax=Providencia stuartii TaxID=588 RepID=UPI0013D2D3D8
LQTYTALLGPKHLSVAGAWFYLGQALAADGARSEADAAYARAIAISDEVAGPFHPNYGGFFVIYRATLLADMGRWNEARALFES